MKSNSLPVCWTPSSSTFAYPKLHSITLNKGPILFSLRLSITYTSRIFEMTLSFHEILFSGMSYSHSVHVSEKQTCTGLSFSLLWSVPFRQREYKNTASFSLNCFFFLFVFNYMAIQYSVLSYIHFEAHRDFCCLKSAETMVHSKPWKDGIRGWQEKSHRENFSSRHLGREDGEREYRLAALVE